MMHAFQTTSRFSWSALLLTITLVFVAAPVQAQALTTDTYADNSDEWWGNLEQQLAQSLDSPVPSVRIWALHNLLYFTTNHPGKADFKESIPGLLQMYRVEEHPEYRVLALMTLQNIADDAAMDRLSEMVLDEPSPFVREITRAALAEYRRML